MVEPTARCYGVYYNPISMVTGNSMTGSSCKHATDFTGKLSTHPQGTFHTSSSQYWVMRNDDLLIIIIRVMHIKPVLQKSLLIHPITDSANPVALFLHGFMPNYCFIIIMQLIRTACGALKSKTWYVIMSNCSSVFE